MAKRSQFQQSEGWHQRRSILLAVGAIASVARPAIAQMTAAAWPARQVRFVIPFAAGGGQDVFWRIIAERLRLRLGATVVVENKAGAGGVLGTQEVARAGGTPQRLIATLCPYGGRRRCSVRAAACRAHR